jgi:hypothetical protein
MLVVNQVLNIVWVEFVVFNATFIVLSMFMLSFIDPAIVLSMFMLSFIDPAIVLSMFMLSFICVIMCVCLFAVEDNLYRFFLFRLNFIENKFVNRKLEKMGVIRATSACDNTFIIFL